VSVYCPTDMRPCIDDGCGGGTCMLTGAPCAERCPRCGVVFDEYVDCACLPDGDDDFDDFDDEEDN
jgi:hypothetical protein